MLRFRYFNTDLSFPVCQRTILIKKDLIIPKQKLSGITKRALAIDIVLSDSSKGGSPLSELPGLAVFWAVGPGDKRPPCYLCVKGHTGLAEEAKATTICGSMHCGAAAI